MSRLVNKNKLTSVLIIVLLLCLTHCLWAHHLITAYILTTNHNFPHGALTVVLFYHHVFYCVQLFYIGGLISEISVKVLGS